MVNNANILKKAAKSPRPAAFDMYRMILETVLLEEVVALVVHEDECREVLYADLPDCLHTEFWVLYALDALDGVLSEVRCRTTDRTEVESAVLVASVSNALSAVTLCKHDHAAAVALEEVNI